MVISELKRERNEGKKTLQSHWNSELPSDVDLVNSYKTRHRDSEQKWRSC